MKSGPALPFSDLGYIPRNIVADAGFESFKTPAQIAREQAVAERRRNSSASTASTASTTQSQPIAQLPSNPKTPTTSPKLPPGQLIATWGDLNCPLIVQSQVKQTFKTIHSATAYTQSLEQAAVVTEQGDQYVIPPLTDDSKFPKGRFSFRRKGLEN